MYNRHETIASSFFASLEANATPSEMSYAVQTFKGKRISFWVSCWSRGSAYVPKFETRMDWNIKDFQAEGYPVDDSHSLIKDFQAEYPVDDSDAGIEKALQAQQTKADTFCNQLEHVANQLLAPWTQASAEEKTVRQTSIDNKTNLLSEIAGAAARRASTTPAAAAAEDEGAVTNTTTCDAGWTGGYVAKWSPADAGWAPFIASTPLIATDGKVHYRRGSQIVWEVPGLDGWFKIPTAGGIMHWNHVTKKSSWKPPPTEME